MPALLDEGHRLDGARRTLAGELADGELAGGGGGVGAEEERPDVVGLVRAVWRNLEATAWWWRCEVGEGGHCGEWWVVVVVEVVGFWV